MSGLSSISVALAVYNGEKFLPELLTSLESQTLKPGELIVVDDCSSDNSIKIIEKFVSSFPKKIFRNEKNSGAVESFRKAVSLCSGEYIALCDQDDIWLPSKLLLAEEKIKKLDANKPAVVFTDLTVINERGEIVAPSFWKLRSSNPKNFSLKNILFGNIITGCTTLFNKPMAEALSKMPANVMMHDHWLALIAYSFGTYGVICEPTVLFRSHTTNVTDKSNASFINNFIASFKNEEDYLGENIEQAIAFKEIYRDKLNAKDSKTLDAFISLKNKNFLRKRWVRDRTSLLRRIKQLR